MSGAADTAAALRDALADLPACEADGAAIPVLLADARALLAQAHAAALDARRANALEATMSGALAAVLAAEAAASSFARITRDIGTLRAEAMDVADAARAALVQAIQSSGAPRVETETHLAVLTESQPRLTVDDLAAVPLDLIDYEPAIKAREAKARLLAGEDIPGLRLELARPGLRISVKKKGNGQ